MRQLLYAQGGATAPSAGNIIIPEASVPDDKFVIVHSIRATLTLSLTLRTSGGVRVYPTQRGRFDTAFMNCPYDGIPLLTVVNRVSNNPGEGLNFDAGGTTAVHVAYSLEDNEIIGGGMELKYIDIEESADSTLTPLLPTPGPGKKYTVHGIVGTWLGSLQFYSNGVGNPKTPLFLAATDNKFFYDPAGSGIPTFETDEDQPLIFTITDGSGTGNAGLRVWYTVDPV